MKHNTEFIQKLMAECDYPKEAVDTFTAVLDRLDNEKSFARSFDAKLQQYIWKRNHLNDKIYSALTVLAKRKGINPYTLHFVYLLSLAEELHARYVLMGLSEELFHDTIMDLRYKLIECMECKGVPGTFVAGWFDGFYQLDRFCYGRFQFELSDYGRDEDYVMKCGKVVHKGDLAIGFHIPSSGVPLTDEVRMASYKAAYERVKPLFPDGKVLFCCGSWLLCPNYEKFLPKEMNVLKFINDFEIVDWHENDKFHDAWRVFGKDADLPYDKLPRDTRMKKGFAEWLCSGGKTGSGYGLILFDGEKIVR